MEVTIADIGSRSELYFGRQEHTGVPIRRFDIGESEIQEITNCPLEKVQQTIDRIKETCPELF